ncbi:MAG: ferredoxin reductase family protein [Actinobacteria bacterium]|nr:ferredoxin reductase family protein [Actinomycetota bacterium]
MTAAAPPAERAAPPRNARPPSPPPPGSVDPRTWGTVILCAIVAGAAATVWMWLQDTHGGSLRTLGDELTAAGRLTGLVGAYLVVIEVLLIARIRPIERLVGLDRLARWHSRNGQYVISLLVVHTLATIAGYAATDHISLATETSHVVLHYPDVLAATVSLALFAAVGVTSARIARRRLAYHQWYFVHLYTYLAVVLAFAHQFATGDDFVGHPAHRVLWALFHVGALTLLLAYRVVAPVRLSMRHQLRVVAVERAGPDVVSVRVAGRDVDALGAHAGQFFLWRFLTRQGWWQSHPFSLSEAPDGRTLRITVKETGDLTRWLTELPLGTSVMVEGPFGTLTAGRRTRTKVLLLAGGIGVTPLRALFEAIPAAPGDVTFLYRVGRREDLVLRDELEALAQQRGARLLYAAGSRRQRDPLAPASLQRAVPDLAEHDVFVCGSPSFVDHASATLVAAGASPDHIHAEKFEL